MIDHEVAVQNQLARLVSRIGKTESVDDIVQSPLKKHEEVLSGDALLLIRLFKGDSELVLQEAIDPPDLLLLPELGSVIRELFPGLTMLPWRITPAIDSTFLGIAPLSLKKEFEVFPPTQTTDRLRVSRQCEPPLYPPPFWRTTSVVRNGCNILDKMDLEASRLKGSESRFSSRPRSFDINIDGSKAMLHRLFGGILRSHLGSKGSALSRSLEALGTGTGPCNHISFFIGNGDDGVVERSLNVGDA